MRTAAIVAASLALAGCADPYKADTAPAPVAGELPAPPVNERRKPTAPAPTPTEAAREAALLASNWTSKTVVGNYRRLALLTTGDARRLTDEAAARLPTDPQLTAPGARSTGTVEAITERRGRRLLIVTRETVSADGLDTTTWRVTLARAERHDDGWLLSGWEPQP